MRLDSILKLIWMILHNEEMKRDMILNGEATLDSITNSLASQGLYDGEKFELTEYHELLNRNFEQQNIHEEWQLGNMLDAQGNSTEVPILFT